MAVELQNKRLLGQNKGLAAQNRVQAGQIATLTAGQKKCEEDHAKTKADLDRVKRATSTDGSGPQAVLNPGA